MSTPTTETEDAVVLVLPLSRDTKNYTRFEIPFDRDNLQSNGQIYLTHAKAARLGNPTRVRCVITAVEDDSEN